jgi:hypothetical protein
MLAGRASGGYSIDYLVSVNFEPFKPHSVQLRYRLY